jgi:hypothetical protein
MANYVKDAVIKGIKSTIIGLVLFGLGCWMWYAKFDGTETNTWAAGGLTLSGIVFIFSPDTWIDVMRMIPEIIRKFVNSKTGNNDQAPLA